MVFGSGDELRSVHQPGGSVAPALFKFSTSTGYTISGLAMGNGVGGASILPLTGSEYHFLAGTPYLRDGASYVTPRYGATILMANDVGTDSDGDGVGNALEATLGLCSGTTGCPNTATGHGRDTDRDGLSDGEEIWGVAGTLPDGSDDLPFARWGANPRKKDVFLEVDYLTGIGGLLGTDTNPFQWMRDNPTSSIDGWVGPPEDWFAVAQAPYASGPNSHLHNPDSTDGVALHLDIGVAPLYASNESKFGAWSTGASRALVPDMVVRGLAPVTGDITVKINSWEVTFDGTGWTGAQLAALIGLAIGLSGEPVSIKSFTDHGDDTATLVVESTVPGQHFTRSISVPAGFGESIKLPRESNGSIRNHYVNDPNQVDVVRIGRVRYAVVTNIGGGGQASAGRFVSGLSHGAFVHELGHTVGIQHWGHNQWGTTGPDCLPHYQSLMRYGGGPYQFSSTDAVDNLNPAKTFETDTFGATYDHSIFASGPYHYAATSSSVDWNRDGGLTSSSVKWRTTALSLLDASCKAFVQGRQRIVPNEEVVGPVALVRGGARLYAFWATGSAIKYKFASLGSVGNKSCTGSAAPSGGDCLSWSATYTHTSGASYQGVSAGAYGSEIFLASHDLDNRLRLRRLQINGDGTVSVVTSWSLTTAYADTRAEVTPELVELHHTSSAGDLAMIYLAESGVFRQYRWNGSKWLSDGELLTPAGASISGGDAPAGFAWVPPGATASGKRTLAILPSTTGGMRVFSLDYSTARWIDLNIAGLSSTDGKPFIAYRHLRQDDGAPRTNFPGHIMIGRMRPCDGGNCGYFYLSTLVDQTTPPGPGLGLLPVADYLQNVWAIVQPGTAIDLYSDPTIDNVFGLGASEVEEEYGLNFYPHADGSPDQVYGIRSDFRVMEDEVCAVLGAERGFPCGTVNVLD